MIITNTATPRSRPFVTSTSPLSRITVSTEVISALVGITGTKLDRKRTFLARNARQLTYSLFIVGYGDTTLANLFPLEQEQNNSEKGLEA